LDPMRLSHAKDSPVSITTEFQVEAARRGQFIDLMREVRLIYLRNGANQWHLYEDLNRASRFEIEVVMPSWSKYLSHRDLVTKDEKEVMDKLNGLRIDPHSPVDLIRVSVDGEVIKKSA
jgi:hypothetical protein